MHVCWFFAVASLSACTPAPLACSTPGTCPDGLECLANRCMPLGGEPVPVESERIVLQARHIAWIDNDTEPGGPLPPAVPLGGSRQGRSALLVAFEHSEPSMSDVDSAFLLLTVTAGSPASLPVELSVWRPLGAWSDEQVTWKRRPILSGPWLTIETRTRPEELLRLDVTRIVRQELRAASGQIRLAVLGEPGPGIGAAFSTGAGPTGGPALEIYLR